jgi:3-methylcrotonyl-CoA carboxylase beta subunit
MDTIQSQVSSSSEDFKANQKYNQALASELRELINKNKLGGGEAAVAKHKKREKLLPRERIDRDWSCSWC